MSPWTEEIEVQGASTGPGALETVKQSAPIAYVAETGESESRDTILVTSTSLSCVPAPCQPNPTQVPTQPNSTFSSLAHACRSQHIASNCGRCYSCMAPGSRATTLTYHEGADRNGVVMMQHTKNCTNGQNQWVFQGDGGPVRLPW